MGIVIIEMVVVMKTDLAASSLLPPYKFVKRTAEFPTGIAIQIRVTPNMSGSLIKLDKR